MSGKFCINLTCSTDNTDRATVAFVVANAAVASDKDTLVFLSIEAVRLSQKGVAESIHEEGFAPLKDLMNSFPKKVRIKEPTEKETITEKKSLLNLIRNLFRVRPRES